MVGNKLRDSLNMKHADRPKKKRTWILWVVISVPIAMLLGLFILGSILSAIAESERLQAEEAEKQRILADPITVTGLYNSLNTERSKVGSPALTTLVNLTTSSEQLCEDMRASNYLDYKNPTSGKEANSFITDKMGDYWYKTYVSAVFSGYSNSQTSAEVVANNVKTQGTNLNNPSFNSVGIAVCNSPDAFANADLKYIAITLAQEEDKPVAPIIQQVPVYRDSPSLYRAPITCSQDYFSYNNSFTCR
jgi:hypothetical protein